MKQCYNCQNNIPDHKKFCNNSCAAKYNNRLRGSRSQETKDKISNSLKQHKLQNNRSQETIEKQRRAAIKVGLILKERAIVKILAEPFEQLSPYKLRKRIFYEQNNKCLSCNLSEWLGNTIPFELNHIDGNPNNNDRTNLEVLCPNCHALTDTYRGRNKKCFTNRGKVTYEQLLFSLLENNWNMRQALIQVNLSPKGGNYKRCHEIKKDYFNIMNP